MAAPNPVVALNDQLELTVVTQFAEQIGLNVLGYKVTAFVGVGVGLNDIVLQLDGALFAAYKGLLCNDAKYYGCMLRRVSPTKSIYVTTSANVGAGTAGVNPLPRQSAGLFTKVSTTPGPTGRGRLYVPFPATADCDADTTPTVGYMVRLGTLAGIFASPQTVLVGADSVTCDPCLLRPPLYPAPVLWTFATARQKFATHRSRGSYGRPNALPF